MATTVAASFSAVKPGPPVLTSRRRGRSALGWPAGRLFLDPVAVPLAVTRLGRCASSSLRLAPACGQTATVTCWRPERLTARAMKRSRHSLLLKQATYQRDLELRFPIIPRNYS